MPELFTLIRSDGVNKQISFEENEPMCILIHPTQAEKYFWDTNMNKPLVNTAPIECHYRFDFNKRAIDAWNKKMWQWLKKQMTEFSNGNNVRAFYVNPYISIGGCYTNDNN